MARESAPTQETIGDLLRWIAAPKTRSRALEALAAPLTRLGGLLRGVTEDGLIVLDGARLLAEKSFYVDQSGERGPREV